MRSFAMYLWVLSIAASFTGAVEAQTVSCSSDDGSKKYCAADTKQGARLSKQRSDAPCKQGESWGFDDRGIWVDHGCSAEFTLGASAAAAGGKVVSCASDGGKKYCDVSTGRGVRLVKQKGDAPCKEGSTWGYDGLGIWVDQGCNADFAVGVAPARAKTGDSDADSERKATDKTCLQTAGKARAEQLAKQCLQVSPATHPPCNPQNSCEVMTDEIRRSCALLGFEAPSFCDGYK
jgi:Protein of unknown function (DUF3011)